MLCRGLACSPRVVQEIAGGAYSALSPDQGLLRAGHPIFIYIYIYARNIRMLIKISLAHKHSPRIYTHIYICISIYKYICIHMPFIYRIDLQFFTSIIIILINFIVSSARNYPSGFDL